MRVASDIEIPRHARSLVEESLVEARVVVVNGPRQAGKTTLARRLRAELGGTFITLDDETLLESARADPVGFIAAYPKPLFIDEVQRAGESLLRAIKAEVDETPTRGRFVLTGSSNFLTVPHLSESLAGRIAIIDLWPFSRGELLGRRERFIDRILSDPDGLRGEQMDDCDRSGYFERLVLGGFPEVQQRKSTRSRWRWFDDYVKTVTQRDVRELAHIRRAAELPKLMRLLAARTAQLLNVSGLARDACIPQQTLHAYIPLLETVYLVHTLPAWSTNLTSRTIKQPKVHVADAGLAAHLLGVDAHSLVLPTSRAAGPLMETFVVNELVKQRGWSDTNPTLYHYRDRDRAEVDIVLEAPDGRVAGIDVKSGATVSRHDFRWLAKLRDRLGDTFVQGIVLYAGTSVASFGDRLIALPITALWSGPL